MYDPETVAKVLSHLGKQPESSQREIAERAGVSLGKANHVIQALVGKGMIKTENFLNSKSKLGYRYILTSRGAKEKMNITKNFIQKKIEEYEKLLAEHSE